VSKRENPEFQPMEKVQLDDRSWRWVSKLVTCRCLLTKPLLDLEHRLESMALSWLLEVTEDHQENTEVTNLKQDLHETEALAGR
jgi:hypothetical protein